MVDSLEWQVHEVDMMSLLLGDGCLVQKIMWQNLENHPLGELELSGDADSA